MLGKVLAIISLAIIGLNIILSLIDMVKNESPRERVKDLISIVLNGIFVTAFILLLVK